MESPHFALYPILELAQTPEQQIRAVLGAGLPDHKGIWDVTVQIVYPDVPVSLFMRSSQNGTYAQVNKISLFWGTRQNQWERLLSSYL